MMNYQDYLDKSGEFGIVKEVRHPIVVGSGLPHARPQETVVFETGETGEILYIGRENFEALVFAGSPVKVGTQITRTGEILSVPVGEELLGEVINPLGRSVSLTKKAIYSKQSREIDQTAGGIMTRARIEKELKTGVCLVDLLLPLGKGQRELIIGDRKTGKTSFLLTAAKTQAKEGSLVIYAVIGKKKSDIKKLQEFMEKEKLTRKMTIVASAADDAPSLIYLTPYTAMTIAEFFRDQGQDCLVILDDLSTHSRVYREIALLGHSFPGRDSYPGDIFYVHSKLLERAGNFKIEGCRSPVAISCLPVAETVEGDLSGYIATNLMGMTDGHIFFDSGIYAKGHRPAINIALSVTRVGRQTQSKLKREINQALTAFLTEWEKLQDYSHFGAELSPEVKSAIARGEQIHSFFNQHYNFDFPTEVQLVLFALIWSDQVKDVSLTRDELIAEYQAKPEKFQKATAVESMAELIKNVSANFKF